MKIAIPTHSRLVDEHFGHCEYYTIYTIDENREITGEEIYEAPRGCGCKSNVASVLASKGVKVLLAGNMGQGAVNKISEAGITVYRGCSGEVRKVAEAFLKDELSDSGKTCNHDHHQEQGHQCGH